MRIRTACLDNELLWIIDDVIGGLYFIEWKTLEAKCAIDLWGLFRYGKFEVQSLLKWKENYIVIIPREIDRMWIFYNKITEEIEYRKIIEQKCQEILVADNRENLLYFCPLYIQDPILIIDLDTLTCSQIIENWIEKVPCDCSITSWRGANNGKYIFFPIRNTRTLVRINCGIQKVDLLKLDISEKVIDVDYAFGELWALPMSGSKLYQMDENGLIVNTVELLLEDAADLLPDFARIVVQKRYMFLLPCYRRGIYVYDKLSEKTYIVPEQSIDSEEKDQEIYLRYWEYCIRNNQILFLPYMDQCIVINLDSLVYEQKEIFYPDIWPERENIRECVENRVSEYGFVAREMEDCSLKFFLEFLRFRTNKEVFLKTKYVGEKVWEVCKNL